MTSLTLTDVGPIKHTVIELPENGGVVVVHGSNGSGKSHALKAANKVLGGPAKGLSARDGSAKGIVELGSAKLTISASRTSRSGVVEVDQIESRADIAVVVDPGFDDPIAADNARIKALVDLGDAKADPSHYFDLCGGCEAFEMLGVDTSTESTVELSGRVKRGLEAKKRQFEKISTAEAGKAAGATTIAEGVDLTAEHDETKLRGDYDQARDQQTKLEERHRAYTEQAQTREQAAAALQRAESSYTGPDPSAAASEVDRTAAGLREATAARDEAERLYNEARAKFGEAQRQHDRATSALKASEDHYRQIEQWRESIGTSVAAGPTNDELAAASSAVQDAANAMELGAKIRTAKSQQAIAEQHRAAAEQAKSAATMLRNAAAGCDDVLTNLIPAGPLRVEAGRLVLTTDRGTELYADLSDGERWRIAIDLACDQLQPGGLLTIPQPGWEGLAPSLREQIHQHAIARGVCILTAQATDEELHAEPFGGGADR